MWLDLLPSALRDLIALHSSRGDKSLQAYYLAQSSPLQRRAVLNSLSHGPTLHLLDNFTVPEYDFCWLDLFAADVARLLVDHSGYAKIRSRHNNLLRSPRVRMAGVANDPVFLKALHGAVQLRQLYITLTNSDMRHLGICLRALRLESVTFECERSNGRGGCLADGGLGRLGSSVNSLVVKCALTNSDRFVETHVKPFVYVPQFCLNGFSRVGGDLSLQEMPVLRRVPTVRLQWICNAVEVANVVGAGVKEVCVLGRILGRAELEMLKQCQLDTFECTLDNGAEDVLPGMTKWNLTRLRLEWERGDAVLAGGRYYQPRRGILLQCVKRHADLRELRLKHVCTRSEELDAVLRQCRLDWVSIPALGQMEGVFDRITRLLMGVKPGVRVVDITDGGGMWAIVCRREILKGVDQDVRKGVMMLVDWIRRRDPGVECPRIMDAVLALYQILMEDD